jgi:hypothetical protein
MSTKLYFVLILYIVLLSYKTIYNIKCGYSSAVERNLAKVDVARSNRVTRYKTFTIFIRIREDGIRTHGIYKNSSDFKSEAFNHSATSPHKITYVCYLITYSKVCLLVNLTATGSGFCPIERLSVLIALRP